MKSLTNFELRLATTMTDIIIFSKIFNSWRTSKSPSSFTRHRKLLAYSKNSAVFIMQRGWVEHEGNFPLSSSFGIFLSIDLLELILVISSLSVVLIFVDIRNYSGTGDFRVACPFLLVSFYLKDLT